MLYVTYNVRCIKLQELASLISIGMRALLPAVNFITTRPLSHDEASCFQEPTMLERLLE